jgi:hypothetical protein
MSTTYKTKSPSATASWRSTLPIHPAADLFPLMSPDELKALGEDIKKNNLTSDIVLWRADPKAPTQLLDGRNRLDAIEMKTGKPVIVGPPSLTSGEDFLACDKVIVLDGKKIDPYAYVVSANIKRRHLSAEDKRDLIAKLIKATPEKSDRQIAEQAKSNRTTVGQIRKALEKTGDVSIVDTRTDSRGRAQPAHKDNEASKAGELAKPPGGSKARPRKKDRVGEKPDHPSRPEQHIDKQLVEQREDIGATSSDELARKDAEISDLRNAKRRLEVENEGLRSEVQELREARDKRIEQLIAERKKCADMPLPPIDVAALPLGDQLIILIGLLQDGLAPIRHLLAALELPPNASVKTRARLEGIEAMAGAVFNWMSITQERVAEIKQALDDYALTAPGTTPPITAPPDPPDIRPPDDGLDIPGFLDRTKQGAAP